MRGLDFLQGFFGSLGFVGRQAQIQGGLQFVTGLGWLAGCEVDHSEMELKFCHLRISRSQIFE